MRQIMNRECAGLSRIQRLIDNSRYFRRRLQKMGLIVYGDDDSPVIPVLLIMPSKIRAFVEELKVTIYLSCTGTQTLQLCLIAYLFFHA